MKYIEVYESIDRLKVVDDVTFQDVTIYIPKGMNIEDLITKLTIELLKGGE